jgi:glycine/D-amino acid oxidase-like deaminating enzyme
VDLKSGYPFWPVNDGLIATYPHLSSDITCDVAILGGGITGALVAHFLIEAGIDAVVLDRRDIGWGSTAASTALLQYEIDVSLKELSEMYGAEFASRAYLACLEAIGTLEALAKGCSIDVGFERKKSLYLASRKRDRNVLREELELRQAIGIRVEWLSEDTIAERFSFRRPAALLSADAAQVDAYAFAHGLLGDAARRGLRVFDRTTILDVRARDDGVTLTSAEHWRVDAKHVVFASGYETRDFLKPTVAELISTFAVASEPMADIPGWGEDRCVIWEHARPYLYLRTTADGRVIVGGEDESFRNPDRRDRVLPKKAERLAERFRELFPEVDFRVEFSWAGTFGETKDGLAYIGAHRDWPSSYFALGYGGNGITYSVIAADIIRDALLGKVHPNSDLFRFDR